MRRLLRESTINQARNAAASARPGPNVEKINKWLSTLNAKAFTPESRAYTGQLSSLFNYYSRPVTQQAQVHCNINDRKLIGLIGRIKSTQLDWLRKCRVDTIS